MLADYKQGGPKSCKAAVGRVADRSCGPDQATDLSYLQAEPHCLGNADGIIKAVHFTSLGLQVCLMQHLALGTCGTQEWKCVQPVLLTAYTI